MATYNQNQSPYYNTFDKGDNYVQLLFNPDRPLQQRELNELQSVLNQKLHALGDAVFKEGDIILIDFCAYYRHYWSDITRCLFIGHIGDPKLEEIYNIAKGANLAAIAAVRPGVAAKDIDKAARDYITNAGYGEFFLHRTGHGLGLSVHEEPYITPVNSLILEEGMTFTIEPGIYLAGIGGVRVEDDILVTNDGCRVLTKTSKDLNNHILKV